MQLALTAQQEAFRDEVRDHFSRVLTPEVRVAIEDDDPSAYRRFVRQLGADGWLCPSWPVEYGGRGLGPVEHFLFFDETQRLRVPMPFLTTNTVGPTIMRFGSEAQKREHLPAIVRGERLFSIGYSEPGAGTDLASLTTRAVRDGDEWVIDGEKTWTSLVHRADFIWLACRTDPDAPKHEGISIIIVPTEAEGFSWQRIPTIGGGLTSTTYYAGVRVPADGLVGEVNGGWRLMTAQLNHERVALASSGVIERRLTEVRRWAQEAKLPDGRRVIDQEWVQVALARVRARLEFLRLLNLRVAWDAARGDVDPADASALKVFGSEFAIEAYRTLTEVVGPAAMVARGEPGAVLDADLEEEIRRALIVTFGGGTNEVQRDIIATRGLGMPRAAR